MAPCAPRPSRRPALVTGASSGTHIGTVEIQPEARIGRDEMSHSSREER